AAEQGLYFMQRLRELQARHAVIGEVRGKGLMIGMELVTDTATKAPAKELAARVIERAFHNGLLLLSCGVSTIRFMPPLLVTRENVDEAMILLEASLDEAAASSPTLSTSSPG
ncbi:MAG TPA: aminotransferase class III-fold pyridoxal phosphate-dependent enzyme, partial [Vicinamibacteria bacterium]